MVADRLTRPDARWQVHVAGMLDALPDTTARALKEAVEETRTCTTGAHGFVEEPGGFATGLRPVLDGH